MSKLFGRTPDRTSRARAVFEALEARALCASVAGVVQNVYASADGTTVTTPLALWRVYADDNGNGAQDAGEPSAVTDLNGWYSLEVSPGAHTIRAQQKSGWGLSPVAVAAGQGAAPAISAWMTSPVVVDVATFYTDGSPAWAERVAGYVRWANQALANSDTNARLNLVAVRQVGYAPAGNMNTDLSRLAGRSDGHLDSVHAVRDQVGADVVVLLNPDDRAGTGLAYRATSPNPGQGFAVCGYTGNASFDAYVFAHEVGHLLGADHDRDHGPGATPAYARGWRVVGADGVEYHDVMAYPPGTALPFFSSPAVWYAGRPLGDAQAADNARAVRQTAPGVAAYRASKSPTSPPRTPINSPAPPAPVTPAPATLVLSSVRTKVDRAQARPGAALAARVTVRNNTADKFTGRVRVTFYLSRDGALDASDTLLRRQVVKARNLRANDTFRITGRFRLPAGMNAGDYQILTTATPAGPDSVGAPSSAALKLVRPGNRKAAASPFQTARAIELAPLPSV